MVTVVGPFLCWRAQTAAARARRFKIKKLFDDLDVDESGLLEFEELRIMFEWIKTKAPEGICNAPWLLHMWDSLPGGSAYKVMLPSGSDPANGDPTNDDATGGDPMGDPTDVETNKEADKHLDLAGFMTWMKDAMAGFSPEVKSVVMKTLEDYGIKEAGAVKLFRLWDDDNSGYLEGKELLYVLKWFETHVPGDDVEFATIWNASQTEAGGANTGDAEKGAKSDPTSSDTYGELITRVVSSLTDGGSPVHWKMKQGSKSGVVVQIGWKGIDEPTPEPDAEYGRALKLDRYKLDLPGFKQWLLDMTGHLSAETFLQTMMKISWTASRHVVAKKLFLLWDADNSGALEFVELRRVMKWFKESVPMNELDFESMWDALPDDGKADALAFNDWMLAITKTMTAEGFDEMHEKIKAHLKARLDEEAKKTTNGEATEEAEETGIEGNAIQVQVV